MPRLKSALAERRTSGDRIEERRKEIAERKAQRQAALTKASQPDAQRITPAYLSRAIAEAVGKDAVIFNEYSLMQDHCPREEPDTYYGLSSAGGLGWGFGAALGAKLTAPDKLVVAVLGDGSYMFSNPMVAHWVADAHKMPILTIIFNNSRYGAVRSATMSMFKDGVAGLDDGRFMADLDPSPAFELALKSQGGHGERVERARRSAGGAAARARCGGERAPSGPCQCHLSVLTGSSQSDRSDDREHGNVRGHP